MANPKHSHTFIPRYSLPRYLKDQRAVITGASSGIGAEYARQLAALGADLVLVARRKERLEALAAELKSKYAIQVECVPLDLSLSGSAQSLFEQSTAGGKIVTLLINNAGIGRYGAFMDFPLQEHRSTVMINSMTPTETTYLFVNHMLQHGKPSSITQIASIAAYQPSGSFAVYCASKGYLLYFTQALAFELRNTNVHLLCVCPGGTYTEFFEHSGQKITASGHRAMMSAESVVRGSLLALQKKKTTYIPGLINKIACFAPRFLPRGLSIRLAQFTMSQAVDKVPVRKILESR